MPFDLLSEGVLQLYPVKASPDRLNFNGSSDNLCEENHTCQVAPSAHRIYRLDPEFHFPHKFMPLCQISNISLQIIFPHAVLKIL